MRTCTPPPWEAWTGAPDQNGFITRAGVDTQDRGAGIIELVVETIETDDVAEHNAIVIGDVRLMAAAHDLLEAAEQIASVLPEMFEAGYIRTADVVIDGQTMDVAPILYSAMELMRSAIAKAKDGEPPGSDHELRAEPDTGAAGVPKPHTPPGL